MYKQHIKLLQSLQLIEHSEIFIKLCNSETFTWKYKTALGFRCTTWETGKNRLLKQMIVRLTF